MITEIQLMLVKIYIMNNEELEKIKEEYYNKGFIVGAFTIIMIILVAAVIS